MPLQYLQRTNIGGLSEQLDVTQYNRCRVHLLGAVPPRFNNNKFEVKTLLSNVYVKLSKTGHVKLAYIYPTKIG